MRQSWKEIKVTEMLTREVGDKTHDKFIMGFQIEGDNFELWILKWKREI